MVPLGLFGLGLQELVVVLAIVVLLFGARRIPEIARGLGQGIRGFRTAVRGEEEEPRSKSDEREETPGKGSRP